MHEQSTVTASFIQWKEDACRSLCSSVQIEVDNISIFVKQILVTELELKPNHFMSTANLFNLPMCYQYGIGSSGFSAWRELAAHVKGIALTR